MTEARYTCAEAARRAQMVRALNIGRPVALSSEQERRVAYERAEIRDWTPADDADAVRVALIWRTQIAQAERVLTGEAA